MGGLVNYLPYTYLCMLVGSLAIMGIPFLTGFYSKDLILELAFSRYIVESPFVHFLGVSAAFFTSVYSIRLLLFVFYYDNNSFRSFLSLHESNSFMFVAMFVLFLSSVFVGYIFSDLFVGWGSFLWGHSIFVLPSHLNYVEADFLSPVVKNLPVLISMLGLLCGVFCINYYQKFSVKLFIFPITGFMRFWNNVSAFFYHAGFFNVVYNTWFLSLFKLAYFSNKYLDKGWLEYFGPYGLYKFFRASHFYLKGSPPAVIFFFIGYMFFFLIFFFVLLMWLSKWWFVIMFNPGLLVLGLLLVLYTYIDIP